MKSIKQIMSERRYETDLGELSFTELCEQLVNIEHIRRELNPKVGLGIEQEQKRFKLVLTSKD